MIGLFFSNNLKQIQEKNGAMMGRDGRICVEGQR